MTHNSNEGAVFIRSYKSPSSCRVMLSNSEDQQQGEKERRHKAVDHCNHCKKFPPLPCHKRVIETSTS